MDLQESREVIRQVDEEMAKLFVKRMEADRSLRIRKREGFRSRIKIRRPELLRAGASWWRIRNCVLSM